MKRRPDWFLVGMVLAALLAWALPGPGAKGGALHPEVLNELGVALIFFLHGLALSFAALRQGTLRWPLHLAVQLIVFVVCPLFGWLALLAFGGAIDPSLRLGLFYLCALPSTVSSSVALTAAAGGNVPAAVFNATLSSVLGVFLTPLWVGLVLGTAGASLPLGRVVLDLVIWLLLPLALGQLFRPLWGAWAARHKPAINVVDRVTILLLVYTSFCDSVVSGVWLGSGVPALLVTLLFSAALLGALLVLSNALAQRMGLPLDDRIVLVFCGSKKTLASGVPMARLMFGAEPGLSLILLPIMIYHPLQLVVCGWLARRFAAQRAPTEAAPQSITFDLQRTALIVVDMQNDFCAPGGWVDHLGADYTPDRAPIEPLRRLVPRLRQAGSPIVWLIWGNRPDLGNMPPNQIHLYKPTGVGIGLGEPLPGSGAHVLEKDSWAAALVDELVPEPADYRVDKYRISGFWDTPLDSILKNLGIRTLSFAGVNTDQCVFCTLTDANFLGYGCVLVADCCATTSPAYCTEATIFNVKKCFGFVTDSAAMLRALEAQR